MGIDQLVNAYKGNPQPLQAKVQQAQKGQPPGAIPPDLEEAIALQKITELRNSAQGQQAMQAGGAQPSVVEKLRQMLGAEQRQQSQPPQMPQGMPQGMPQMPQGQPPMPQPPMPQEQPVMAARGGSIDQLMSNLGRHYAGGGIVAFTNGGDVPSSGEFEGFARPTPEQEARDEIRAAEQERMKKLAALEQKAAFLRSAGAPQAQAVEAELYALKSDMRPKPSPTDPDFRRQTDPRLTGTPAASPSVRMITDAPSKSGENVRSSAREDSAPMPAGLTDLAKLPSVGVGRDFLQRTLADNQKFNEEEYKQKYLKEVGAKDVSVYDEMAAELKARKERLNAPKQGFDSLMEYLGAIAQGGGGRNWMEAGAKGAANLSAMQKARQAQQDALVDKIIDLGAKKKEAEYGERLSMFTLTKAEKEKINKESAEIAKSLNMSEDKAEELRQNRLLEEAKMKNQLRVAGMGSQDNLMSRAAAIRAENKGMSMEESMRRAALAGGAASVFGTETKDKARGIQDLIELNEKIPAALRTGSSPMAQENRAMYNQLRAIIESKYGPLNADDAKTSSSKAIPIPAGAGPGDLPIGTIYQTARGPAKWNGKAFEPVQ